MNKNVGVDEQEEVEEDVTLFVKELLEQMQSRFEDFEGALEDLKNGGIGHSYR